MPVERTSGTSSLLDILDRVLDHGIQLEAPARAALAAASPGGAAVRLVVLAGSSPTPAPEPASRARGSGA
jgi:hypothetical protein